MRISDWSSDVCSSDLMSPRSTNRFRSRCWTCSTSSTEPPPGGKQQINADSARRTSPEICRICRLRSHSASPARSEEHTSELQTLMRISYSVFCLTKKKPNILTQDDTTYGFHNCNHKNICTTP